jgi:hypothetical protein
MEFMIKDLIDNMPSNSTDAFLFIEEFYTKNSDELSKFDLLNIIDILKIQLEPLLDRAINTDTEDLSVITIKGKIEDIIELALPKVSEKYVARAYEQKNGIPWLTEQQKNDIQTKINELREAISTSGVFDDDHKGRLLKLLEELQQEIHKRVSDYDLMLAKLLSTARTVGEIGKESKPFIDRIKDIVNIFGSSTPEILELPPSE